jgi:hypothetical protein
MTSWVKSSFCSTDGCVEVAFRKSSYSGGSGNCVETGFDGTMIHVRDSKDPGGACLKFTEGEWDAFTAGVRDGEFVVE